MAETCQEFIKAFPDHFGCHAAFVVWAKQEINEFLSTFKSQVFVNKTPFAVVSDCVQEMRKCCDQLSDIGVELTFVLDCLMAEDIEKAIQDAGDNQMDAVRHRAMEDNWLPMNFQNVTALQQFENSMINLGIKNIHKYTFGECFTELTQNTIQFTKSYLPFLDAMMTIYSSQHHRLITAAFVDILEAQIRHAQVCARDTKFTKEKKYIVKNAHFLVHCVLPLLKTKYEARTRCKLTQHDSLASLLKDVNI